ncbi:MAG: hybrid sensor histidine kinase/response regulator [Candidatus Saccharibacteria bacterium]|nr:hybrid sensor histidine kinase/response regulator [Rhodoferax sp.]
MSWVARNAHSILLENISLRFANEQLARTNADNTARAEQASRAKSEFFAAASHDLRQPVHALLLLIEAYRNQVPGAAQHPLILNISAAGQSIASLFNALMELSRLESGQEKAIPSTFDLPDRMQRLLAQVRPVAHRNHLRLRCHTARTAVQLSITTDKVLFERIVVNLLSNALRYTAQGGVLLSLRRARAASGWWLEVWDTGLGIANQDLDRIFDPYTQLANAERDRSKGLGLGLAIVQRASTLLGVTVTVHSHLGRGSCFRLHLPPSMFQQALLNTLPLSARPPARTVQPAVWLQGKRILLVDDDPMVQSAMQAVLGSWSLDLRCAGIGDASALDVCGLNWVPDCVLCDFRLPGQLDGIAMLDLLQEHFPQTVGILQTAELAQTVQARAADAGYMVLYKPVQALVLESTLAAVLKPRALQENA